MHCSKCHTQLNGNETFCPNCGACIEHLPQVKPYIPSDHTYTPHTYSSSETPEAVKKWNWGAFMFNAIWGIGNYNYLPLLCFIPLFNLVWVFVCGIKGNEWAWKSGRFTNLDDFIATQETWNRAGRICFFIMLGIIVLYILLISLFFGMIG